MTISRRIFRADYRYAGMFLGMHTRLAAKLFHTIVVLGVGLTAGCSSSDTSEPNNPTPASTATTPTTSSGTPAPGSTTQSQISDAGNDATVSTSSSSSSSSGNAFPGWLTNC